MGIRDVLRAIFNPPEYRDLPATRKLSEAVSDGISYDPDANMSAAQLGSAYVRRLTGASPRDLTPLADERARDIAYALWDRSAIARRIVKVKTDYILADGVTVAATDKVSTLRTPREDEPVREVVRSPALQERIDAFWTDNQLDQRIHGKVMQLWLLGEQCWPVTVNPSNGAVKLSYLGPEDITSVIVDPQDVETAIAVALKPPLPGPAPRLKVIRRDDDPRSPSFGRLVGIRTDRDGTVLDTYEEDGQTRTYAGACFFYAVNKVSNATRGRSDLLCVCDWIDLLDQFLFNEMDRALIARAFVWDVTLTGQDEKQIDDYVKKNNSPKPGSLRAHNEKVVWQAVTPSLDAADSKNDVDMLIDIIASGADLPKTWLNATIDTNRATAQTMDEPTFRAMTRAQRLVLHIIEQLVTFALDQAELVGRLPRRAPMLTPAPWPFTVTMPELRQRDMKVSADALAAAVGAFAQAIETGQIDSRTATETIIVLVEAFGLDLDIEDVLKRIAAEKEEREAEDEAMFDREQQGQRDLARMKVVGNGRGVPR